MILELKRYIEKKYIVDEVEATGKLAKGLSKFLRNNVESFTGYDIINELIENFVK